MRALIGNCSHSEGPLIDILIEQNWQVTSIGNDKNAYYSDKVFHHELIDYRNKKEVEEFLSKNRFDLYVPACNELFLKTIVSLGMTELFGLGSNVEMEAFINKSWISKAFNDCKVLCVAKRVNVLTRNISSNFIKKLFLDWSVKSLIFKPLVSAGGLDVCKLSFDDDLEPLLHSLNSTGVEEWVIEEYLDGSEFSLCTFIDQGAPIGFFWDLELSNPETHTIDASCYHNELRPGWLDDVREDISQVCKDQKIPDGLFHIQIIESKSNVPFVIDVTRRMSGDLYGIVAFKVTGFDMNRFYLNKISNGKVPFRFHGFKKEKEWISLFRFVVTNTSTKEYFLKPQNFTVNESLPNFYVYPAAVFHNGVMRIRKNKRLYVVHSEGAIDRPLFLIDKWKNAELFDLEISNE